MSSPITSPVLITAPLRTRQDLYDALGRVAYSAGRRSPTNLDGMADLLQEHRVKTLICACWLIDDRDTKAVTAVLDDLDVKLCR